MTARKRGISDRSVEAMNWCMICNRPHPTTEQVRATLERSAETVAANIMRTNALLGHIAKGK